MQLWTPGQPLQNGRFIIQQVLGSGGFGVTYSAIEYPIGKLVVIKTLNQQQQSRTNFQQQQVKFVNEALRLRGCSHLHIVKVYEMIQEAELWGMVMEHIDGQDLWVYVDERGALPESEALRYIDQVGKALESVHQQELLHRDVKPHNIMLRRGTQEAVLIDFGLAREFTVGITGNMTNARTAGYAPIEQYERRGKFDTYTDVYALAATLYTLLTAEVPLPADFRKNGISLPPPKQHNFRISNRVNDAIVKGMALELQDRPQTVREFRELLGIATIEIEPPFVNKPFPPDPIVQPPFVDKPSPLDPIVDYAKLEGLLRAHQWKEADRETYQVMLQAVDRQNEGWMRAQELSNFPCTVLRKIDQLWVEYSDSKFGLSVQQRIWRGIRGYPGKLDRLDSATFYECGNYVGWRRNNEWLRYDDFTFSLEAQEGHLPSFGYGVLLFHEWLPMCSGFLPRIIRCL
jgi:eukaryotic-like serine/threonine-protein kinase